MKSAGYYELRCALTEPGRPLRRAIEAISGALLAKVKQP